MTAGVACAGAIRRRELVSEMAINKISGIVEKVSF